jgi:hypothetical protein
MKDSLARLPLRRTRHHWTDHLLLHFHMTSTMMSCAPSTVTPSPVLRQNWEILAWLASPWSKPSNVDTCPHTVFILSSVLRSKPINLPPLVLRHKPRNRRGDFETQITKSSTLVLRTKPRNHRGDFGAQITKPSALILRPKPRKASQWFWGQTTDKPSPPVLRLNWKTHTPCLLHVYDVNCTRCHLTSWSSGHWVPDLCMIIPDPPRQVSYSCHDPHHCLPCRTHHLHIMR